MNVQDLIQKIREQTTVRNEAESSPDNAKVYRDEPILFTAAGMKNYLPERYRQMRKLSMQNEPRVLTTQEIFYRQAKFMEDYEDDFAYDGTFFRYYPTYQSMNDAQLRSYFTWRTKVRHGVVEQTSLSYVFVYIYELLNCVGGTDPLDCFRKLCALREEYGRIDSSIQRYLDSWLRDFVVYYNLDAELLASTESVQRDKAVYTLMQLDSIENAELFEALCQLSSYNPMRSRFYKDNPEDLQGVLCEVYRDLTAYYLKHRKYSLTESLFGRIYTTPCSMFSTVPFFNQKQYDNYTYKITELSCMICKNNVWSCTRLWGKRGGEGELGTLIKSVDSRLRTRQEYPHPLKTGVLPKYMGTLIDDAIERYFEEKEKRKRREIHIDTSILQGIRDAAEVTRDKLIVEPEEEDIVDIPVEPEPEPEPSAENELNLNEAEQYVLRCLLMNESPDAYLREKGLLLSVVADGINEKCFDLFSDTVLEFDGDSPQIIEDYADELKGMIL